MSEFMIAKVNPHHHNRKANRMGNTIEVAFGSVLVYLNPTEATLLAQDLKQAAVERNRRLA